MAIEHASYEEVVKNVQHSERKYPWAEWTDGKWRTARHGTKQEVIEKKADFSCKPASFVCELRDKGRKLSEAQSMTMKVKVRNGKTNDGTPTVAFRFYSL